MNRQILYLTALASFLSAITTAILMYGPSIQSALSFEAAQSVYDNPLYLYKKWILFFHPQFAFLASLGALFLVVKENKKQTLISLMSIIYLFIWAYSEMNQQAHVINALNNFWRPAFVNASGSDELAIWETIIRGFSGYNDSQYFLLLFGFSIGSIFFGLAFWQRKSKLRVMISLCILLIGFMSLLAFMSYYTPIKLQGGIVQIWYGYLYGPVQISVRALLGIWLLKNMSLTHIENKITIDSVK
ncbi:MAG: hypothetical protein R3E90_10760 [Marinicella sp.]